jgi:hypothetical protein
VGVGTSSPGSSAIVDIVSTSKGLLPPRMTYEQRNAIVSPAEGLMVFCTNCRPDETGCISLYFGGQWLNLAGSCEPPSAPVEGIHVQTNTQIIWNWSAMPIASGYKWHTTNNFAAATNMGTATTKTETGLAQGTSYTRYVWAYNACGHNAPVVIQGQALTCGTSFTRTHSTGTIAPVSKIVTYGTVTNIPGELSKCWITRNLGASQQATAVNDATEASAGWYWQFNRKQGYRHDGTTRIPNTVWVDDISEDSDWESANDPCSLLLGSAWRIPTSTEWTNLDAGGNWISWTGPFGSELKMHAAGYLGTLDGSLLARGFNGFYWSSNQLDATNTAWALFFANGLIYLDDFYKALAFSTRCVRD